MIIAVSWKNAIPRSGGHIYTGATTVTTKVAFLTLTLITAYLPHRSEGGHAGRHAESSAVA
jgi:hypothetical protein